MNLCGGLNFDDKYFGIVDGKIYGKTVIGGRDGGEGQEIELRGDGDSIQWKYVGEEEWRDITSMEDCEGGREIELERYKEYIAWRYVGEDEWTPLVGLDDLKGENGREVELENNGYSIVWRIKGDRNWLILTSLRDITGENGKEIELGVHDGFVQWHYVGEEEWINLIDMEDLKGDPVEFEVIDDEIKWKYQDGDDDWHTVIPLSEIKGKDGKEGKNGREVIMINDGKNIAWKYDDAVQWMPLVPLKDITGASIKSIDIETDDAGVLKGGYATMSDSSRVPITITVRD